MNLSNEKSDLLYKLWRKKCFRDGHEPVKRLLRVYRNEDINKYKNALDELIKDGLVRKFSHKDQHVQLNTNRLKEIRNIIEIKYNIPIGRIRDL